MVFAPFVLVLAALAQRAPDPDVRLEHFVLEVRPAGAVPIEPGIAPIEPGVAPIEPGAAPIEIGLACLRCRSIEGGYRQLELECLFRRDKDVGEDEHVLHVERNAGPGPALVWREWGASRSRCLTAERTQDGTGMLLVESSRGGIPRGTIAAPADYVLPLELFELAREGKADGRRLRLDPLSRSFEAIEVATRAGDAPPGSDAQQSGDLRVVELAREDKSPAGRLEFRGNELVGFQWQDSDLHARRVTQEMYAQKVAASAPAARRP